MTNRLDDEVQRITANMDNQEQQSQEQDTQSEQTIHVHYFPDAIVILKEDEDTSQFIDSTPITPQNVSFLPAYAIGFLYLLLIVSTLAFQLYCIFNPPIATVTIIPKSQTVRLTGTLQLGRVLTPLTISQSQTTPTTGKGHQIAKEATGYVTFYNGLFTSQTIAQGTILTGTEGIQIVTTQEAIVPAGNPPSYGQVTISAHAINPGSKGNIPAYDINQACCVNAVLAKNTAAFTGGQNERDFSTVSQQDINKISTPLKTAVGQSMRGALQEQVHPTEQLYTLPCSSTQTSDHLIGDEARAVTITVSEICSAIAYNQAALQAKVTKFLTTQAEKQTGAAYSLFGVVNVHVIQAAITHTATPLVFLSFQTSGNWIYGLSNRAQEHIQSLIAHKTTEQALHILQTSPGVDKSAISWGIVTKLPKDTQYINIRIVVV